MKKLENISLLLLISLLLIGIYAFLHEGGHALLVILFGGKVTAFDINFITSSPHVEWSEDFGNFERSLISIAGPMLPFILWGISIPFVSKIKNVLFKKSVLLFSVVVISSFIPNIIIPVLYEIGTDVQGEDIARFTQTTDLNGYLVSFLAVLVFSSGIMLLMKHMKVKEIFMAEPDSAPSRNSLLRIALGILTVGVLIYCFINIIGPVRVRSTFKEPTDYDHLLEIDLSELAEKNSNVYAFEVDEPKMFDFIVIGNTKERTEIILSGSSGIHNIRSNEMNTYSGLGKSNSNFTNWILDKGKYHIRLTNLENKGNIKLYIREKEIENPSEARKYSNENIFQGNIPDIGEGYELVFIEKLLYSADKGLYEFTLNEEKKVQFSVFLTTRTGRAVLKLTGDGHQEDLISDEQIYTTGRVSLLKKGTYTLSLTAGGCDGEIYVFIKK